AATNRRRYPPLRRGNGAPSRRVRAGRSVRLPEQTQELVTTHQPSPNGQFSTFLSRFPPEIVALVRRSLPKLRRAFPGSYELVYDYSNSLVVAFRMSEHGYEAIVAIAIFPPWVRLCFDKSLPDPKGLLEGSGAKVRSVTLKAASHLDHG